MVGTPQVMVTRSPSNSSYHQHAGAVGVHHALGIAGGARRVADRRRAALVELWPDVLLGAVRQQILVAEERAERRARRHRGPPGHQHVAPHRRESRGELFGERQGGRVDEQPGVLGMIDDVGDLVGVQARVDRVQDGAGAGDAVEQLEVPVRVPGQRADAVARSHAEPAQRGRQALRPAVRLGVGVAVDRPVDLPRDDLGAAVDRGGVLDRARDQERQVHDQPLQHRALVDTLSGPLAADDTSAERERAPRRAS
jgi:hypothetical protein